MVVIFKEYMISMSETFKAQLKTFSFGFNDFVDIVIVAVLLYYVYKFIKERRAGTLAIGLGVILLVKILSDIFSLSALSFIINNFFQIGLLAIVILFQPELRSALEQAGGTSLKGLKNLGEKHSENTQDMITAICEAACEMSKSKTGALIVFENQMTLNDIVSSGTVLNAEISSYLIRNIFYVNTPLHDGAMVIRKGRICAAGCFLPLSDNQNIEKELGTRHRAAIGMSEVSDALVLVVSEETGIISIVKDGKIKRNFDFIGLKAELTKYFVNDDEESAKKRFNKFTKNFENKEKTQKPKKKNKKQNQAQTQPKEDEIGFDLFDGESEE